MANGVLTLNIQSVAAATPQAAALQNIIVGLALLTRRSLKSEDGCAIAA